MRYADGDPNKARTANAGFACRVDTSNGIWGFCPETVIAATDCGLAAACVDSDICADVCGLNDGVNLTTVTWYEHLLNISSQVDH